MASRTAHSTMDRLGRDRLRNARGELLLELLMTVSIVTTCIIGLVGALGSNFHFSAVSRQITNVDQLLARYGEALAAVPYEPCGVPAPYGQAGRDAVPTTNLPIRVTTGVPGAITASESAFAFSISSVQYWNQDTSPATFAANCPASDHGVELLVLQASAGDGSLVRTSFIVKRAP